MRVCARKPTLYLVLSCLDHMIPESIFKERKIQFFDQPEIEEKHLDRVLKIYQVGNGAWLSARKNLGEGKRQ